MKAIKKKINMQTFRLLANHLFLETDPTEVERREMNYCLDHTEETARKYYQVIKEKTKTAPKYMDQLRCPSGDSDSEEEHQEENLEISQNNLAGDDREEEPLQRETGNIVQSSQLQVQVSDSTGSSDEMSAPFNPGKQEQELSSSFEQEDQEEEPRYPSKKHSNVSIPSRSSLWNTIRKMMGN
jgi:hypothetical protein